MGLDMYINRLPKAQTPEDYDDAEEACYWRRCHELHHKFIEKVAPGSVGDEVYRLCKEIILEIRSELDQEPPEEDEESFAYHKWHDSVRQLDGLLQEWDEAYDYYYGASW